VFRNTTLSTSGLAFSSLIHFDFEAAFGQEDPHSVLCFIKHCLSLERLFLGGGAFERLENNVMLISIPHLTILHVKDVLTSMPTILRIFPIPSEELFYSVVLSARTSIASPQIVALRDRVLGQV
jgi:hypothetical protein